MGKGSLQTFPSKNGNFALPQKGVRQKEFGKKVTKKSDRSIRKSDQKVTERVPKTKKSDRTPFADLLLRHPEFNSLLCYGLFSGLHTPLPRNLVLESSGLRALLHLARVGEGESFHSSFLLVRRSGVDSDCSGDSDCSKWGFDPGATRIARNGFLQSLTFKVQYCNNWALGLPTPNPRAIARRLGVGESTTRNARIARIARIARNPKIDFRNPIFAIIGFQSQLLQLLGLLGSPETQKLTFETQFLQSMIAIIDCKKVNFAIRAIRAFRVDPK